MASMVNCHERLRMALFEYFCKPCKLKFEQIVSSGSKDAGVCPKCGNKKSEKLISKFAIGGQGDQRESTLHGCHEGYDGVTHAHSHDSGHDEADT